MVALCERSQAAGRAGSLDKSRLFRTTFTPSPGTAGGDAVCRWAPGRDGDVSLTFLVRSGAEGWPPLEVTARLSPDGVDMRPVAAALASAPGALTVYYRVRGVQREAAGEGSFLRYVLEAEVAAAHLGTPETPSRAYFAGTWEAGR